MIIINISTYQIRSEYCVTVVQRDFCTEDNNNNTSRVSFVATAHAHKAALTSLRSAHEAAPPSLRSALF